MQELLANASPVQTGSDVQGTSANDIFCSHLAVCDCVVAAVSGCGPPGSPGRGELLRLSTLGELLLVETSLLLQLLVDEEEEALDTTNPGERQPCRTGAGGGANQSGPWRGSVPAENSPDPHSRPSAAAPLSLSATAGSI